MKKIIFLALLTSSMSFAAFAAVESKPDIRVKIQDQSRRHYGTQPTGSAQESTQESKILNSVQNMVRNDYHSYNVNISVSTGVVTLSGFVSNSQDIKNIEADVRRIPGVTEVHNHLTLQK